MGFEDEILNANTHDQCVHEINCLTRKIRRLEKANKQLEDNKKILTRVLHRVNSLLYDNDGPFHGNRLAYTQEQLQIFKDIIAELDF